MDGHGDGGGQSQRPEVPVSMTCMQDIMGTDGLKQRETWRRKGASGKVGPVPVGVVGR